VAELADAQDSKSCAPCGHEGSTPSFGTIRINHLQEFQFQNPLKNDLPLPGALSANSPISRLDAILQGVENTSIVS
jgi:hypothetical protein